MAPPARESKARTDSWAGGRSSSESESWRRVGFGVGLPAREKGFVVVAGLEEDLEVPKEMEIGFDMMVERTRCGS